MIISHRGNNNHHFKENSLLAIKDALSKSYIDGVEFDIRITKDKKFILNHGFINNGKIIKYTNSKYLNSDNLKDVLKSIKSNKLLLIEIKDNDYRIIDLLYKILKKFKNLNIQIITFYKELAIRFKKKYPSIKIGIIVFKIDKNEIYDFICIHYLNYKKVNQELFVWTVNNKDKIKRFNSMNINIITDKPYLVK